MKQEVKVQCQDYLLDFFKPSYLSLSFLLK